MKQANGKAVTNGKCDTQIDEKELEDGRDLKTECSKPCHPIDTGWSWVILFGTWVDAFLLIGAYKSYGMFFIEFLREFQSSVSSTTLLTTVMAFVGCATGVFVLTYGMTHISTRKMALFGAFTTAVGYGSSAFATNLGILFACQSLIGFGHSFIFGPNLITLSKYFNKKRGLANGILSSGNSIGGFVLPYLFRALLDEYGLQGALLLTSGILLNSVVATSLLRPVEFYSRIKKKRIDSEKPEEMETFLKREMDNNNKSKEVVPMFASQPNLQVTEKLDLSDTVRDRTMSLSYKTYHDKRPQESLTGSLSNSVRYLSNGDMVYMSINNLEAFQKRNTCHEKKKAKEGICECFVNAFSSIFDFSVLKNVSFFIFTCGHCCGMVAPALTNIFVPAYARDIGIDDQRIATLISIVSVSDFFARILVGYISDKPWIRKHYLAIIAQVIIGILMNLNPFYDEYWKLLVFAVSYGAVFGTLVTLFSPILVEILGVERFGSGIVPIMIIQSLSMSGLAPFLGYLRDVTNSYHMTLHCLGIFSLLSSVILSLFDVHLRCQRDAKKKDDSV